MDQTKAPAANRIPLPHRLKKLKDSLYLRSHTEYGEEPGEIENHSVEHQGNIVSNVKTYDGEIVEHQASHDMQEAGHDEKVSKQVGGKDAKPVKTVASKAAEQAADTKAVKPKESKDQPTANGSREAEKVELGSGSSKETSKEGKAKSGKADNSLFKPAKGKSGNGEGGEGSFKAKGSSKISADDSQSAGSKEKDSKGSKPDKSMSKMASEKSAETQGSELFKSILAKKAPQGGRIQEGHMLHFAPVPGNPTKFNIYHLPDEGDGKHIGTASAHSGTKIYNLNLTDKAYDNQGDRRAIVGGLDQNHRGLQAASLHSKGMGENSSIPGVSHTVSFGDSGAEKQVGQKPFRGTARQAQMMRRSDMAKSDTPRPLRLIRQTKVSVEPHPDEVIDVDPKIISGMKQRLQAAPEQPQKTFKDHIKLANAAANKAKKVADPDSYSSGNEWNVRAWRPMPGKEQEFKRHADKYFHHIGESVRLAPPEDAKPAKASLKVVKSFEDKYKIAAAAEAMDKTVDPSWKRVFSTLKKNEYCGPEMQGKVAAPLDKAGFKAPAMPAPSVPKVSKMDEKKQQLLQLARMGKERPLTSTPLGHALANYTDPSSFSFDPRFAALISRVAPQWAKK